VRPCVERAVRTGLEDQQIQAVARGRDASAWSGIGVPEDRPAHGSPAQRAAFPGDRTAAKVSGL